jgi:hypothetical protein
MMSYSQMIDSPRISAKRSQLESRQRPSPVAREDQRMECELDGDDEDARSNCTSCASRPYHAYPQAQQHHLPITTHWSWGGDGDGDDEDAEMSSSGTCAPPSAKKQRRSSDGDEDDTIMTASHTYSRRDSSFSVSSIASQQSGHRKSRNRAFNGQDFQRLIISQF